MYVQHPITDKHIAPFVGQHVCAVLLDGTPHYGVVTGYKGGKLILNGNADEKSAKQRESGKKQFRKSGKAQSAAKKEAPAAPFPAPPVPFIRPAAPKTIKLSSIGLLFALLP